MTRICANCGATVARVDCHRNRFGEYLCRVCQKAGVRATPAGKLRAVSQRSLRTGLRWLGYAALAALLLGGFWVVVDRMANPTDPAPPVE